MTTKVYSAFPGTGKSWFTNKYPDIAIDSDSSEYSWVKDENGNNTKERNPDFPQNYINHIKNKIGKVEVIFVSSHKIVRDALVANNIPFTLVYPSLTSRGEYLNRYKERGNMESFINLLDLNWTDWILECVHQKGCKKILLDNGEFISDHLIYDYKR